METFLEYETMCRETPLGHVLVGSLAEIEGRSGASSTSQKQRLCDSFRALSETHRVIFALETCKA